MSMTRAPASLSGLRGEFRRAGAPALEQLDGRHRAEFVGPAWWRTSAPGVVALLAMPRWWGKEFRPDTQADLLVGENLLGRDGDLRPSFPMQAQVAPSRVDGRAALVVRYPRPAPWTWRQVTDELRPVGDDLLLGLTFSTVPVLTGGLPFLLHRVR